ncbi:WD40 repeat domain-containing protein [Candidatus Bipolaricaulota bacterium]|nr:WD40 repeat domain-containing protein [Candidatus Bipolaricaulota bacterium]
MSGGKRVQVMMAVLVCIWAWRPAQGEGAPVPPLSTLKLDALYELSFTPDVAFLGVATYHGVFLYTVPDLEEARSFPLPGIAYCLAFSPDGHYLAAGTYGAVWVWDFVAGEPVSIYEGDFGNVYSLSFTPDSRRLLIGTGEGSLILWEVGEEEPLWARKAHSGSVRGVAVSPDGALYASGGMDQGILWSRSGEVLFTFPGKAWNVAFSPDGYFLAVGAGKVVKLWDTAVGLCYRSLWEHTGCVWWVEFSPDGRLLASSSLDHTVRVWDPEEGECLAVLPAHEDSVECVRFSPNGRFLSSGAGDGTLSLWDLPTLLQGP